MPLLRLPNSPMMALLANAIANLADGEFRQFGPAGLIEIEFEGKLRLERSDLLPVTGTEPADETWQLITEAVARGTRVAWDDRHVIFDADDGGGAS